jgi:hypothetical protein
MSQASSPGRCCWPMSLIRCGGPSAVRTRTAAKRASSRPLVPPTHISPLGFGQHVFGCPRQDIWNVPLAGTAPTGNRPDQFNPDWIHLLVTRETNGPGQAACREPLTERRAEAITGIRQHTAKTHTGCHHAIDLRQGDLWLGPRCAVLDWNARTLHAMLSSHAKIFGVARSGRSGLARFPRANRYPLRSKTR